MDIEESIRKRVEVLNKVNRSKELQNLVNAHCSNSIVDWVDGWVWTYDPRRNPSQLPMVLWDRQREYLLWRNDRYINRERGIVEKSRDAGVTWLNVIWQLHKWLYEPGFKGSFGSRKLDLVDQKDNPDSILEKSRYVLRLLPKWMLPRDFVLEKHASYLRILNPANGSVITGEGGDQIGRGGRSSIYDLDEAAFIEHPQSVEAALSQNTECVIETSTPNGPDNPFAVLRHSGKVHVFTFHWRDDPRKDEVWYEKQKLILDPITLAQEVDIDYNASRDAVVINKAWVDAAIARSLHTSEQRAAKVIGVDIATYGRDNSAYVVREGLNFLEIQEWHGSDPTESADRLVNLGKRLEGSMSRNERLYFAIDGNGVGAGTVSSLRRWIQQNNRANRWSVIDVQAAGKSNSDKTRRKRDELWWKTRELFSDSWPAFSSEIPKQLLHKISIELASPGYKIGPSGEIQIESKDSMKSRGVASPNLADALIHTMAVSATKPVTSTRPKWLSKREWSSSQWVG